MEVDYSEMGAPGGWFTEYLSFGPAPLNYVCSQTELPHLALGADRQEVDLLYIPARGFIRGSCER